MRALRDGLEPMRILQAVHAFLPQSTAGVEVYTFRQARALQGMGHEVLVLSAAHDLSAAPGSLSRRRHEGVDVVEVNNVHHEGTLEATYSDPGIDRVAEAVLREFRPEGVHVQHLLNLSAGILGAARHSGAAVVLTIHDYWLSCPRDGLRMRADLALCRTMEHAVCATCLIGSPYLVPHLQRGLAGLLRRAGLGRHLHRLHDLAPRATEAVLRALRRASPPPPDLAAAMDRRAAHLRRALDDVDLFLAPTGFVRDRALEFGVSAGKLLVSPFGIVGAPTQPRAAGARRRVGYIGTLAPHKGVHVLVDAFRGTEDPDVTLDVYGSLTIQPSYVAALRLAAGPDPRIRFHGAFPEGEQARAHAGLDVLVVPSLWWENSPLTILEALARGTPVIASGTGGVPEIVADGTTGLVVPPGDVEALRRALLDVTAGRRLGEALPALRLRTVEEGARDLIGHCERILGARLGVP